MADEFSIIERFIYQQLSADATLVAMLGTQIAENGGGVGIFSGHAPLKAVFPLIVMMPWPGGEGDLYVNGNRLVWTNEWYLVVIVDERTDYEGLENATKRMYTLLSITNEVGVTGGRVNQSIRKRGYRRTLYEGANQEFRQSGAIWDIRAQPV